MSSNEIRNALAESDPVEKAKLILRGVSESPADTLEMAKRLMGRREFGTARRILARARKDEALNADPVLRLKIHQQSAVCTYKDPDLPVDTRLNRALEILRAAENLSETRNQETLGIAGSVYKRKWEVDNQKSQLERALFYYLRGYAEGAERDQGYNGINAAFVLDLLASQEGDEARKARIPEDSDEFKRIESRRAKAKRIREEVVEKVAPLAGKPDIEWLQGQWWFYSTVAEAFFGLGPHDEANYGLAVKWLRDGKEAVAEVSDWEFESTVRQLAALARAQAPGGGGVAADFEATPAWRALKEFLGDKAAPVRSAFTGKVGLGLSGGGFRASLFHIGVLAKLAELDLLRRVEVLSCVSGGSIIGAHYYLEVRKLLQSKPDAEITREDYIEIVKKVQDDFLLGVQRNVRTRVAAKPLSNLKMLFGSKYSRTMRAGELFEEEIFSRVRDGGEGKERWLNDLYVLPKGEPADFRPKHHNWRREAKVPILILNAATLNTGHGWHFTASYMGEPPANIDSEIDGNDRLRRMYYREAPEGRKRVRLGHAVAASACVPGLFEPIALTKLYPERVVRLVDGGVCDNQGIAGLLEQDCNVILVSDGSGQMESLRDPGNGLLGVPLRTTSILQARVRQAQYQDLAARKRSQVLRGFMFVHLKGDLDVDPVDWLNCQDPYSADDDDSRPAARRGPLTRYGVAKDLQQLLASVRTDLDSFSDVEAYALMTSAYRMTEQALKSGECVEGYSTSPDPVEWGFLAVEGRMRGEDNKQTRFLKRLLSVSDTLAFKIWKLSTPLKVLAWVLGFALIAATVWAFWRWRDTNALQAVTFGAVGLFILTAVLTALAKVLVGKNVMRVVQFRQTLVRAAIGLGVGLAGWLAARLHLHVFDRMYLRLGSLETFKRHVEPTATGLDQRPVEPLRQT